MAKEQINETEVVCDCGCACEAPLDYEELCAELRKENTKLLSENQKLKDAIEMYKSANFKQANDLKIIKNIAKVSVGFVQQMEALVDNAKNVYNALEVNEEE